VKINNFLKTYRKSAKLTQEKVAKLASITTRNYQRIENGLQDPKTSTALLIAQALNTTVEELFPFSQENSSDTNPSKE